MSRIVLVQPCDHETARRIDALVREEDRARMTPLMAGTLVRRMGAIAPILCPCGCGRLTLGEDIAELIERRATRS
jgi:hypothetical protein